MEDRVPGDAGRPGGRFGNLKTTASLDEFEFPLSKKRREKLPNKWRKIKPSVHQVRLHSRGRKETAESVSREKLRQAQ